MTTRNLGSEGFRWFIGVVEDRNDPLMLGRVRVRIHNMHSPKQSRVSTDTLPWASVMTPVTSAPNNKVGASPTGMQIGTTVIGFFADGEDGNAPIIMGGLAGIPGISVDNHDVPPEAREINTVNKVTIGSEPEPAYRAKYPYNKVLRTESGHVIEVDDTPNFERIHIYHNSGTYIEMSEEGRFVLKAAGNSYDITAKDKDVYVQGNVNINVKGNVNMSVGGTVTGTASAWNLTGDLSVQGNISSSKQVSDGVGTMGSMRSTYNSHTHSDPQGGSVSTPSASM